MTSSAASKRFHALPPCRTSRLEMTAKAIPALLLLAVGGLAFSSASAKQEPFGDRQLIIQSVEVLFDDDAGDTIIVRGENFDNGDPVRVSLGDLGELEVLRESSTEIEVACPLPDNFCPYGDFRMLVLTGKGKINMGVYPLTIGAIGPEGPPGPQGEVGPSGIATVGSGLIDTGTPGESILNVDYANLETTSGIRIESKAGSVTVKATGGNITIDPAGNITIESDGDIDVVSKQGDVEVGAKVGSITMSALQSINLEVGGTRLELSPANVLLDSQTVDIEGTASVDISGLLTTVTASGVLDLNGAPITLN